MIRDGSIISLSVEDVEQAVRTYAAKKYLDVLDVTYKTIEVSGAWPCKIQITEKETILA
jgi:hypothetical protein